MPDSEEKPMPSRPESEPKQTLGNKPSFWSKALRLVGVSSIAAGSAALSPEITFPPAPKPILQEAKGANPATGLAERLAPLGVGIRAVEAAPLSDSAATETLTSQMRREIETKFTVDDVGYRISNTFTLNDGFYYLVYQGLVFQRVRETGEIRPWNTLDVLHDRGYDAFLDDYVKSGVTIPAHVDINDNSNGNLETAFNNRIKVFGVNPKIEAFARALRAKAEIGVPTSPTKDYGSYTVTRFQRVAIQEWTDGQQKGLIQRILTGEAFLRTGMVPRPALLASPDLNFGRFDVQPQPEQPVKTEETVNVPPLPPGGFLYNEQQVAKVLNDIPWYRKEGINEKTHTLQLSGKLVDWSVDGDNLVLKIATNKENPSEINEIVFVPQEQDSIWFEIARYPKVWTHYKSIETPSALKAMDTYFKKGDPIDARRRIRGGPMDTGYTQRILTWR